MKVRLPIEIVEIDKDGFHIFVSLFVNGLKANAIIDTGASRSVLDKNRVLHFTGSSNLVKDAKSLTGIGSGKIDTFSVVLNKLSFSEVVMEQQTVMVVDLSPINKAYAMYDLPHIDMVVGGELLVLLHAVIDYPNRSIIVSKSL